jgi:hypothetical protein
MDKIGVTLLLRKNGMALSEAHDATDSLLHGRTVSVALAPGTDVEALRKEFENLGVIT